MLLFRKSSLWGCYKPRHVTKRDMFLFINSKILHHTLSVNLIEQPYWTTSFFYLGLDFSWQIGEVEAWPEVHKLFDVVHLSCSADDSVKPMPAISIWAGFDELPHKELVNSFE